MTSPFTLKKGKVVGQAHLADFKNCQDSLETAHIEIKGKTYIVGWVSDGCSFGAHSEVGSNLATQFLTNKSVEYLERGVSIEIIPLFLFDDLINFLKINLKSQSHKTAQKQAAYINDFLLFTLTGFIIGPKKSIVMAHSDGLVIINEDVHKREFGDEPPYVGYLVIDPIYLKPDRRPVDTRFDIYSIPTAEIKKIAVGTDGWLKELDLLPELWNHKHPNQVQRNMNIWSDNKRFSDDTSIIVVEKVD